MTDENYYKSIGQILYVLDYLFIEPSKSNYIQNIPNISRIIADHKFWKNFLEFKEKPHQNIMYMNMILFDDLMNELPDNLIETTLAYFEEKGIVSHMLNYFTEFIADDYEHLSWLVLFIQRISFNQKCKD